MKSIFQCIKGIAGAFLFLTFSYSSFGQMPNWQNLDLQRDSVFGISTEKAYSELLQHKKFKPVIVAVIDAGTDTTHEDLKSVLWHNPKEKVNGKDDDHNGYVDDVYGWNFIGSSLNTALSSIKELARHVAIGDKLFNGIDSVSLVYEKLIAFRLWKKEKIELDSLRLSADATVKSIRDFTKCLDKVLAKMGTRQPTLTHVQAFKPENEIEVRVRTSLLSVFKAEADPVAYITQKSARELKYFEDKLHYSYTASLNTESNLKYNDFNSFNQHNYGSPDVYQPELGHGTHVAGIIGADRMNGLGIKGVADHVQLMTVRIDPLDDKRDKDVANGIRYAVDNGAKIINMSFDMGIVQNKDFMDTAIKYAMAHDVLIVHGAGNDNQDLDKKASYPNGFYTDGSGSAEAWIEVGASGMHFDRQLKASFSNYGNHTVDVFAPGVNILSCVPGSKYESHGGTSMAAPIVSGLAALLREYYPKLTAIQVKDIICRTVVPFPHHVFVEQNGNQVPIEFSELSKTGGVVNAYDALKLAATY